MCMNMIVVSNVHTYIYIYGNLFVQEGRTQRDLIAVKDSVKKGPEGSGRSQKWCDDIANEGKGQRDPVGIKNGVMI